MRTTASVSTLVMAATLVCAPALAREPEPQAAKEDHALIHGFRLLRTEPVREVDATAYLYEHVKSGARLLYLASKDDNKVFSIAFRTPPPDDTGLPHILEHSVLCGSRKYPVKEPFIELVKGSVKTFLNAMTYSDKTMYPVASKNDKDFMNLMDVYLDAVFHPRLVSAPEILKQEGWHYEIDPKTGALTYNGVVYNEMKGVFSSPEETLSRESFRSLFPDTPYGRESGGDPDDIPRLTQKQFTAFHAAYYHPSNSFIFLYGNGDRDAHLRFLDREYLSHYARKKIASTLPTQKPFAAPREVVKDYSINAGDSAKDRTFMSLNWVVGRGRDPENYLAMDILTYMLLGSTGAPVKRALIEAKVAKDVDGSWDNGLLQPVLSITLKGTNPEQKQKFADVVRTTLEKLVRQGIPPKLIEAAVNRTEFELREFEVRRLPKGLVLNTKVMDSWLYGGDPLAHLEFELVLAKIRALAGKRYFEKLIAENLLKNRHRSLVVLKPKKGLGQAQAAALKKKLAAKFARLSEPEKQRIRDETAALKKAQRTPDPPEALATIPMLAIKDLDPKAERLPLAKGKMAGVPVLRHGLFTNHIAYFNLYFDTTAVPEELIPYVTLLSEILGKIDTAAYRYQDLDREIDIHTGGITHAHAIFTDRASTRVFYPRYVLKGKALVAKFPRLAELVEEVVLRSKFDDVKRLRELVQELRAQYEQRLAGRGVGFAVMRAESYFSRSGKYEELAHGLDFYRFLVALEKNFDARSPDLVAKLRQVSDLVFNRRRVLASLTCDEQDAAAVRPAVEQLLARLPNTRTKTQRYRLPLTRANEGLVMPSKVNYVVAAGDFRRAGFDYSGAMLVLRNLLSRDYLWNKVRVQGGAYGCYADLDRAGTATLYSYRDPNVKETYAVYDGIPGFLKQFSPSEREMTKLILGTVSGLDQPLTPSQKGEVATARSISHISHADVQRTRDQVLRTRPADLKRYAALFAKLAKQANRCTLGGEEKIQAGKDLFGTLVNVLQ